MRVLIACEFSGVVRDAFIARGHDAWSCDFLPREGFEGRKHHEQWPHWQGDVLDIMTDRYFHDERGEDRPWDLIIAHPPCTYLCSSGARWWKDKAAEQDDAIDFFMKMVNAPCDRIVVENPIGIMSTKYRKPDQIIQPWQHGHGETKATCLWLKNLPKLVPSNIVAGRDGRVWKMSPSKDRWKERSRTLPGIAKAMAEQWGNQKHREAGGEQ